jgi:hypothetical protein
MESPGNHHADRTVTPWPERRGHRCGHLVVRMSRAAMAGPVMSVPPCHSQLVEDDRITDEAGLEQVLLKKLSFDPDSRPTP